MALGDIEEPARVKQAYEVKPLTFMSTKSITEFNMACAFSYLNIQPDFTSVLLLST